MVKPPINDSLTSYDLHITDDLSPSRDRIFSEIRLSAPFDDLYLMTYLQATYKMSDDSTFIFYGWIDDVQPLSDSDTPTTAIHWHIDYWRTYASNATYGSGMVTRRPDSFPQPPQPVNYRYMIPYSSDYTTFIDTSIVDREDVWWVCVRYSDQIQVGGNDPVVRVKTACYPVSATQNIQGITDHTTAVKGSVPTLAETENGLMDELLGLLPENIISAFISPCSPVNGFWDDSHYYHAPAYADIVEGNMGAHYIVYGQPMEPEVVYTSRGGTNDIMVSHICGFDGESIGTIPWGVTYSKYDYRVVFESVNAYIQLRLYPDNDWHGSRQTGLTYSLPLPALEITENSWSSYVYSGARQADIEGRRLQRRQQVAGGLTSALSGMATGAAIGSVVPGLGTAVGAAIGGVTGVANMLGTSVGTGIWQEDEIQAMNDTAHAEQPDGLLLQGNGFDAVRNGVQAPAIFAMTYDDYSITQWENNISIYGATVSEPTSSCASLIRGGGPLRIDNLEVTGDIPNPARAYIRDAFRKGVILK